MKKYLKLAAALMAVFAISCQEKPEPEPEKAALELKSETSLSVPAEGGNAVISFVTNQSWEVSSDADWVSVSPAKGGASTSEQKVNLVISANTSENERSAKITLKAAELTKEVSISQDGKKEDTPVVVPSLELQSPAAVTVAAEGLETEISFITNQAWTAVSDAAWVVVDPAEGAAMLSAQKVKLTVAANDAETERSAKISVKAAELVAEVVITQEAKIVVPATKEIMTVEQFEEFADSVNAGCSLEKWLCDDGSIKLGADLDFTGKTHVPIGIDPDHAFIGTFDGQGHTIDNLKYETPKDAEGNYVDLQFQAIFGYIGNDADETKASVVKNFTVGPNCSFKASKTTGTWFRVAANVSYVSVNSSVEGLVNRAEVTIVNRPATAAIRLAGVVASSKGNVTNCKNYGKVWYKPADVTSSSSTSNYSFGGVAAFCGDTATKISGCENYGDVEIDLTEPSKRQTAEKGNSNIGGVVGIVNGNKNGSYKGEAENCTNYGKVYVYGGAADDAWNRVGGVVGNLGYSNGNNLVNKGEVLIDNSSFKVRVGGVVGFASSAQVLSSSLTDVKNEGKVTAGPKAAPSKDAFIIIGGAVGLAENYVNISKAVCSGTVETSTPIMSRIGGIAGSIGAYTSIDGTSSSATVIANTPANIGGVLGYISAATASLKNVKMTGCVRMSADQNDADTYTSGILIGNTKNTAYLEGNTLDEPVSFAVGSASPVMITKDNWLEKVVKSSEYSDKNIHIKACGGKDTLDGVTFAGVASGGDEPQAAFYAEWLLNAEKMSDYEGTWVLTNENAKAQGSCGSYINANKSGSGKIEYFNGSDKTEIDTGNNCKRSVGNTGHPLLYGAMAGDYFLFTANADKTVPAGTKINVKYITRVSAGGCCYWILEYLDGTEWVATRDMISTEVKGTKDGVEHTETITYNIKLEASDKNNSQVDETFTYKNATAGGVQFRMRLASSCTAKGAYLINPTNNTARIAGAVGTSPVITSID